MNEINDNIDLTLLYDYADEYASYYKRELINANAVATGNLLHFLTDVEISNDNIKIKFRLPHYYWFIEYGRGISKKNEGNILEKELKKWIVVKHIPLPKIKGRYYTLDEFAKLLAFKIHNGSLSPKNKKPRMPLKKAKEKAIKSGLKGKIEKEIGYAINREVHETLLKLENL